ncbi:hypothetical protein [Methanosarcina sp.]|uniref:hypothetical protein n=1 Tax=Methanosarcina sp. TaxID=2213 RepID=UPI003BB49FBE
MERLGIQKGLQRGLQGRHEEAIAIAKNLLKKKVPLSVIKSATGLSEQELILVEDIEEQA